MPQMSSSAPSVMSIPQGATYLGVSPRFVRRLVDEGRVPYLKVGRLVRLRVADLDAFLDDCRVKVKAG